jgi:hypothetical protein
MENNNTLRNTNKWYDVEISFFRKVLDKMPSGTSSLRELLQDTEHGKYRDQIQKIRQAAGKNDTAVVKHLKKLLPAFTLSGRITSGGRANAFQEVRFVHSGWLQGDFDRKDFSPLTADEVKEMLDDDEYTQAVWLSPTGGIKILIRIPVCQTPDEHERAFNAAEAHYFEKYGLRLDPATKDPVRLCYVSYDPDIRIRSTCASVLHVPPQRKCKPERKKKTPSMGASPIKKSKSILERDWSTEDVREMLSFIPPRPPYEEWLKISSAVWNELGAEGTPLLMEWSPEEAAGEYAEKFSNRLKDVHIGTLIRMAQERGYKRPTHDPEAHALVSGLVSHEAGHAKEYDITKPFPTHCLPEIAGNMVREMARVTTSQNEPLAAAAILGTLSAALGAGLEVSTGGGRTVRGNLFLLVVAESGTGKGENFDHAMAAFNKMETAEIQEWESKVKPVIVSQLAIADKRAKRVCDIAANAAITKDRDAATREHAEATAQIAELGRKLESWPRYRVADVTKEALAIAMQGQPGEAIASMSSEARGIFSIVKGRYGKEGGDEDFYCSGFSGDTITVDRVGRPRVVIHRPCLAVLWMIQPDAARMAFADSSLMESGMLPRFLLFDPKAEPKERFGHHTPIPRNVSAPWHECVSALLENYRKNGDTPQTVPVSKQAREILDDFERETVRSRQRQGNLADVAPFVARWAENAWRMVLVLHAARHGENAHHETIKSSTARDAVEIARWFAVQQLEVLRAGRLEKLKGRLSALLAILACANGKMSFRDLRRSHAIEEEEIRRLQTAFPDTFKIRRKKAATGRPSWVATTKRELEDNK